MVVCLCATRNMYPQLWTLISFLLDSQPINKIYAFVEDDFNSDQFKEVRFINLSNFAPLKENKINNGAQWTYMTMARIYFPQLLPEEDRVIYLDLDLVIQGDLLPLWELDLEGKEIAGVADSHLHEHNTPYITDPASYINAGVLVMDLAKIRENKTMEKMDKILHTIPLMFFDQDCISMTCSIKLIDAKWNSGFSTLYADNPIIRHPVLCKPWNPASRWFTWWVSRYLQLGAPFSRFDS